MITKLVINKTNYIIKSITHVILRETQLGSGGDVGADRKVSTSTCSSDSALQQDVNHVNPHLQRAPLPMEEPGNNLGERVKELIQVKKCEFTQTGNKTHLQ